MNRAEQSAFGLRWAVPLFSVLGSAAHGQITTRVSLDASGAEANGPSAYGSISVDGRYVAFHSGATNLVPGDANGFWDVFVHDRQGGTVALVSVDSTGTQGNDHSLFPRLSADGRFVAFESDASNLVAGDTNIVGDVFVHDRQTGITTRVSLSSAGAQGNGTSRLVSISPDGRYVTFVSVANNLVSGDSNDRQDVFVHDRQTATTSRISRDSAGVQGNDASSDGMISADGRFVAFSSLATNLVPGDTNGRYDTFIHDRMSGVTTRVSVDSAGTQGDGNSFPGAISPDGHLVVMYSAATNLVSGDTNGVTDVFVHDRLTGITTRLGIATGGAQANGETRANSISTDVRFVALWSRASNLVPGDTNGFYDNFVHDRQSGVTTRVSVDSAGAQGDDDTWFAPALSADGRYVAFWSAATNLISGDTNGQIDVFVRDQGPPPFLASCFGDGTRGACPCANSGSPGHGCENSSSTGGALLSTTGTPSLLADTLVLTAAGEKSTALSIVLQGTAFVSPVAYGDGLRCTGAILKRLYTKNAVGGNVTAPQGTDPSVSSRSAALGDPIPLGATRHYQVYYRDAAPGFCPSPQGGTYNISNALSAVWSP